MKVCRVIVSEIAEKSSAGAMACNTEVDRMTNAHQQKSQPDMQVQLRKATKSIDHNPEDLKSIHV